MAWHIASLIVRCRPDHEAAVAARLNGPRIPHAGATEIVSDGMVPGCIQIPPAGQGLDPRSERLTGGVDQVGPHRVAAVVEDMDDQHVANPTQCRRILRVHVGLRRT